MTQLEGNGALRLLTLLGGDKTQPTAIKLATVQSVSPLAIRIDGESIDTPAQGLVTAEHLTDHEREWRLKGGGTYQTYEIRSNLRVGNRVIVVTGYDGQLAYIIDKAVI